MVIADSRPADVNTLCNLLKCVDLFSCDAVQVKTRLCIYTVRGKTNPVQAYYRPRGFQEFEAPRFQDNRYMKVGRLSAQLPGHLYRPVNIPGTHFC